MRVALLFLAAGAGVLLLGCEGDPSVVTVQGPEESLSSELSPPPFADFDPDIGRPLRPPPMVLVPSGSFTMGTDFASIPCSNDMRTVTLTNDFHLGQYEITNREYRAALQWAYDQDPPLVVVTSTAIIDNMDGSTDLLVDFSDTSYCEISYSDGNFTVDSDREDHPMMEVSWYGSAAYCDWLSLRSGYPRSYDHSDWSCNGGDPYGAEGYRLPTDAEWEYAAQYNDGRHYPWGDQPPDCNLANFRPLPDYCVGWTTPVGSYPAAPSALELYDMAGNVSEWVNDWWLCYLGTEPQTDPAGPAIGVNRIMRGGTWATWWRLMPCASRYWAHMIRTYSSRGFRIARTL